MPVLILLTVRISKQITSGQRQVMEAYANTESNYIQTLQGIDTIKVFQKEKEALENTSSIYQKYQSKIFELGKINLRFNFPLQILGIVYSLSIIAYASFLIFDELLTIGQLTAILTLSGSIFPTVIKIVLSNVQIQGGKVAFERMFELTASRLDFDPKEIHIPLPVIEKVSIQNLTFRFPGRKALLKNLSCQFEKGKVTAFLGESGSGKTTLMHILEKFYQFESGEILINNSEKWEEITHTSWRNKLSSMSQEVTLFNGILAENISMKKGNQEDFLKVIAFCKKHGFDQYFSQYPQSYLTKLGEGGTNISGGQTQLVGLARALYKNADVVLLDEPTSSMDKKMSSFVMNLLHKLKSEKVICIITHEVGVARNVDNAYVLESGKISLNRNGIEL